MAKEELKQYDVSQATHKLKCRHNIGRNGRDYTMPCIVLGRTKSRRLKIVVFGERYWLNKGHLKRIRYVFPHRVVENREAN